jgi:acyl-CoA synthetase (AMP-forming)/AMP-acid ligase II
MLGLMQQQPLLISNLVDYVATWHAGTEIVSRDPEGVMHRSSYGQVAARAKRVANALTALGVGQGDRVATLAWNSWRHLEIYYGVTCSGRVLHTVNPRLFAEQLVYIINHAENGYVFFDPVFAPLVEQLAPHLPLVRGWIALCEEKLMPAVGLDNLLCYETLLAQASPDYDWQSQGRSLQPSLDRVARLRRLRRRRPCALGKGFDPGDRAAVPRQCVEPAVFGGDVRRQTRAAWTAA